MKIKRNDGWESYLLNDKVTNDLAESVIALIAEYTDNEIKFEYEYEYFGNGIKCSSYLHCDDGIYSGAIYYVHEGKVAESCTDRTWTTNRGVSIKDAYEIFRLTAREFLGLES
jgi:hypothetical protein